ncbi:hypothetical protein [Corallococcus caeni]|uniref:Thiocillin family RiPP n=1 Tax=Corallococcus caeni TaxID=3082388 RepID=A0ABQ6QVD3_9BACT|nr:hypothetical protein ASNO1_42450 [Corallococcus sp. NO1]
MDKKNLLSIDELDITPLSDDELDSVAGGVTNSTAASCMCCVAGATEAPKDQES